MTSKKSKLAKQSLYIIGTVCLLIGITLVLVCWEDVVTLFKGLVGMALAVGGLVLMFMAKD